MTAIDIVQWLGETSLAVSILILLVLLLRKPFTNAFGARAAYALWLAPAARLFLPELKILPAPSSPEPLAQPIATAFVEPTVIPTEFAAAAPAFDFVSLGAATALVVWALVAFAWFNIKLESQSRFMREMIAASKPAPASIMSRAKNIAQQFGLKRVPQIRVCHDESGPCIVGLFRPVIFLPAGFEKSFTERERHLALAHEIAHIARGDMAATLAAIALQSVQWPNPLAHFAFRKFRTDQEAACDAFVLARCMSGNNSAGEYAAAIMKSVRAGTGAPAYGLSLAHPVKERLMLLRNQKKSPLRILAGTASAIAVAVAGLGVTASYGYAPEDEEAGEQVVKRRISLKSTIEADSDETMEIEGVRNPAKVEYENENGKRTIKIYNKRGRLISENVYEKGEEPPFDEIIIRDKDGEARTIKLDGPLSLPHPPKPLKLEFSGIELDDAHEFDLNMVMDGEHEVIALGDEGKNIVRQFAFVSDDEADTVKRFAVVKKDGPHVLAYGDMTADCLHSEDGESPMVFAWSSTDEDEDHSVTSSEHEVICLTDANADPEKRAELLKKTIEHMERNAKREAERREKMIAKMREELKELEKSN